MPRNFLKNFFSNKRIKEEKTFSIFGDLIHDQNLWHMRRRSVAGACGIGLFCAFIPLPFQMLIAAGFAIILRCNLPISVALVWITNPITMPPLFYLAYKVGAAITDTHLGTFDFELSFNWLFTELRERWRPFMVGCLFLATSAGLFGFVTARILWRIRVVSFWNKRKLRKLSK